MSSPSALILRFITSELLPAEEAHELTTTTSLIGGGVLNSLAMLKLVDFLERTFAIRIAAHETGTENFDDVARIVALVEMKRGQGSSVPR